MPNSDDEQARLHAVVAGIVQGVSFRYLTLRRAGQLGLSGWVRNLRDGSVEVVAEGSRADLESLAEFLRVGPPGATVTDARLTWQEPSNRLTGFEVRYT